VSGEYADFDEGRSILTIRNFSTDSPDKKINRIEIAKVLDGQHRIEGLKNYSGKPFQINVAIFVDIDIEDQAYLFSTVNLAQTKVNKSLVYDLFDYAKSRSPQKTSHNIAVALDNQEGGPFHLRIKRLGAATPGRVNETITQATFVEALMSHITADPIGDRNILLQGKKLRFCSTEESRALIFRNWFVEDKDMDIADVLLFYFSAVRERWPEAWNSTGAGMMLNKTNGFRALMRILRPAYLYFSAPGGKVQKEQFLTLFSKSKLRDADFNIDNFKPGTSGEGNLRNQLIEEMGLASIK
jgi:DGQHR domain-containing protein